MALRLCGARQKSDGSGGSMPVSLQGGACPGLPGPRGREEGIHGGHGWYRMAAPSRVRTLSPRVRGRGRRSQCGMPEPKQSEGGINTRQQHEQWPDAGWVEPEADEEDICVDVRVWEERVSTQQEGSEHARIEESIHAAGGINPAATGCWNTSREIGQINKF